MRLPIAILVLALIGTAVFAFVQYRKANRFEGSKFLWEYEASRDIVTSRFKADGRLMDVCYDRNRDLENDSCIVFGRGGGKTIWVDEDYDGWMEVQYLYDRQERLIARYEDIGQDGHVNEYIRYAPDSIFVYRDVNEDAWFEEREIVRRAARQGLPRRPHSLGRHFQRHPELRSRRSPCARRSCF